MNHVSNELVDKNLARAGEYFMYSLWIQTQLSDLIILYKHPRIIKRFVDTPSTIPFTMRKERIKYWQKDFGTVKKEFEGCFAQQLTKQAQADLLTVYTIRNAIGHSSVSFARNYLFYRPNSKKKLLNFKKAMRILNKRKGASPIIYKMDFSNDDLYFHNFAALQRLDEIHLKEISKTLRIPHSRIR